MDLGVQALTVSPISPRSQTLNAPIKAHKDTKSQNLNKPYKAPQSPKALNQTGHGGSLQPGGTSSLESAGVQGVGSVFHHGEVGAFL